MKEEHKTCKRTALALFSQIDYRLYRLRTMGLDGCITEPYVERLQKIEDELTIIRREIKYGKGVLAEPKRS